MAANSLDSILLRVTHNDQTLPEVRLAYNFVGDQGATAVGKALTTNFHLQKLSLASARIGPFGIVEICKGVAHNRGLQVLTLYGNELLDDGGTALGRMLLTNRTLTKLDLDDAHIGPRGCVELCKGLMKNKTLLELNMQENNLGDEGLTALGNTLAVNTTLKQVAIGGNRGHTDAGLTFLALGLRRAPKRADQLKLTGIELASVAETIGLGAAPGGWSTIKMLQVFHDGATVGGGGGGGASSKTLSEAVSKPISWTSATVHLTNEKYEAATGTLVAGDTYIIIVTLYDDWGEIIHGPHDYKTAAAQVLSLARPSASLATPEGTDKFKFLPIDRPGQLECKFTCPTAVKDAEIKVCVGNNPEHVVGGQTLSVCAAEPSRVPHAFKMLWAAGQTPPAKWCPGLFPGDAWELAFKVLDDTGRALECAPPQIKVSLRPLRPGVGMPYLQVRAAPPSQIEMEEAKRRRTSYSSLPTSFILSLVQPIPANARGIYTLEVEVKHGDMEIQLQMPDIGFEALPSRTPLEWQAPDVLAFLRSHSVPIDPAAECICNHEGVAVDGRILLTDGPELLLSWIGKYDPETRAAVKAAQQVVADLQTRAMSLGASYFQQPPAQQAVFVQPLASWPPPL